MIVYKDIPFNLNEDLGKGENLIQKYKDILDVINTIRVDILYESWDKYPESRLQYYFYKLYAEKYPQYLGEHPIFDQFDKAISQDEDGFLYRRENFLKKLGIMPFIQDNSQYLNFHNNIEKRSRFYTAPLVKIGFLSEDRFITPAGHAFWHNNPKIKRDELEQKLDYLSNEQIVLLRQIAKLRIFSRADINGNIMSYIPFNFIFSDDRYLIEKKYDKNIETHHIYDTYNRIGHLIMSNPYNKGQFVDLYNEEQTELCMSLNEFIEKQPLKNMELSAVEILWKFYTLLYQVCITDSHLVITGGTAVKVKNANYRYLEKFYIENKSLLNKKLFMADSLVFGTKLRPSDRYTFLRDNSHNKEIHWFDFFNADNIQEQVQNFNRYFFVSMSNSYIANLIHKEGKALLYLLDELQILSSDEPFNTEQTFDIIKGHLRENKINLKPFEKMDKNISYEGTIYSYFSSNISLIHILDSSDISNYR